MVYAPSCHSGVLTSPVLGLHAAAGTLTAVEVIQDLSGYPLYVDGGASWVG
jgi:hypothetical protein